MKKWEKFSKEEIELFVTESKSYAELAEKFGYEKNSGSYIKIMKDMINQLSLDISHFTFQGWNKDNFDYSRFRYGNNIKSGEMTKALIHLRGHKCERCGNTEWLNKPIPLQVHHKDGDGLNTVLENLELLCPNCHALTDNFCGKNQRKNDEKIVSEEDFVNALRSSENIRQALKSVGLTAKGRNYLRAYELIQKYNIEKFFDKYK